MRGDMGGYARLECALDKSMFHPETGVS